MPTTKERLKAQPAQPVIERYVTIKQTVEMYDISKKTVERYVADETLPVVRDRHRHVKIDLDILEQVMREKEIPPHPLKQQLDKHQKRIEDLEREAKQLREQLELTTGRVHALERLLAAMSTMTEVPSGEINVQAAATLKQLIMEVLAESGHLHTRKTTATGLAAMLEKRGLPENTMRLVGFAKVHQINLWEVKKAYLAGEIQLKVYQREGEAQRNKQEWWVLPEHHRALIAHWQAHGMVFTVCDLCAQSEESIEESQAG